MTSGETGGAVTACAACGAALHPDDAFCEACGAATGMAEPVQLAVADPPTEPAPCRVCGGAVEDGYCSICGVKAPTLRDHWSESPAAWVAGVCDRGIMHARNEDAMALAATDDGALGVLVVCDGVTTAPDSDRAALAAARAACRDLAGVQVGVDIEVDAGDAAAISFWDGRLRTATRLANGEAVGAARVLGDPPEPPSCTLVAAVVTGADVNVMLHVAWCGDSRCYWVPDEVAGPDEDHESVAVQISVDHSLGTELVRGGMSQAEAEHDQRFHTITRWLGADSADATPDVASLRLDRGGYVVVVSDGLWNYASSPPALTAAIRRVEAAAVAVTPLAVAEGLVAFANGQGGHDNVTVAIARIGPLSNVAESPIDNEGTESTDG